jgi:hypothetical protein
MCAATQVQRAHEMTGKRGAARRIAPAVAEYPVKTRTARRTAHCVTFVRRMADLLNHLSGYPDVSILSKP